MEKSLDRREHAQRDASEVLNGRNISAARNILRQVLGNVSVWPDTTRNHLLAKLTINAVPLLQATTLAGPGATVFLLRRAGNTNIKSAKASAKSKHR